MARNHEKREKREIQTVGPGKWQENRKTWKMRHKHCMTWNMARNPEKRRKREMHFVGPRVWQEN